MEKDRIDRIREMEAVYDRVKNAVDALDTAIQGYEDVLKDIPVLAQYEESGLWTEDYEADERGELPRDLKRGVLSQDGLDTLFDTIIDLLNHFKSYSDWKQPGE